MKKNGFTLTEILAVVIILSLLLLIIAPNLLNSIQNRKPQVTEAQKQMIEDAANIYIENNNPASSCITFQELQDNNYLNKDFENVTDEEIIIETKGFRVKKTCP